MSPSDPGSDDTGGPRLRLGDLLVASNELSPQQVEEVLREQSAHGGRFGDLAVALGLVSQEGIERALARQSSLPAPEAEPTLRLGDLLVASSAMSPAQVERVLEAQASSEMRFGELAVALGFVTPGDIEQALARQSTPAGLESANAAWQALCSRVDSGSPMALRMADLHRRLADLGFGERVQHKTVALASAGRCEAATEPAAHLAIRFAREGRRTLLIEADLRSNALRRLSGTDTRADLRHMLQTGHGLDTLGALEGLPLLSILPCDGPVADPLEVLSGDALARLLDGLRSQFDLILMVAPGGAYPAESQIVCQSCGHAVIVHDGDRDSGASTAGKSLASILARSGVTLCGSTRAGD
jgi:Mrp family chromosome partitioning ATPase